MTAIEFDSVADWLREYQQQLRAALEQESGDEFLEDPWQRDPAASALHGSGNTCVAESGAVIERGAVNFSDVRGERLPPAATARNPRLAGQTFRAVGVSAIVHPRNPHAPTGHMNLRLFAAGEEWWFGGGMDLTPHIAYAEDVSRWQEAARQACAPLGADLYPELARRCEEYFYLPHRGEMRGVGGLFYDDLNDRSPGIGLPFEHGRALACRVGAAFLDTYTALLARRKDLPHTERERAFQLWRRGRYAEFNLTLDRGTLFGLQSGGRIDSILASLPPLASWSYRCPEPQLEAALRPWITRRAAGERAASIQETR